MIIKKTIISIFVFLSDPIQKFLRLIKKDFFFSREVVASVSSFSSSKNLL